MELYGAAVSLAMATSIAAFAQNVPAPPPADAAAAARQEARLATWRQHPLPGHGPFAATRVEEKSLPTHTIYRPANMADVKAKLPIVSFGNGGCRNTSIEFIAFLAEIASHGYFVVAAGRNDVEFATNAPSATPSNRLPLQVMEAFVPGDATVHNEALTYFARNGERGGAMLSFADNMGELKTVALVYRHGRWEDATAEYLSPLKVGGGKDFLILPQYGRVARVLTYDPDASQQLRNRG